MAKYCRSNSHLYLKTKKKNKKMALILSHVQVGLGTTQPVSNPRAEKAQGKDQVWAQVKWTRKDKIYTMARADWICYLSDRKMTDKIMKKRISCAMLKNSFGCLAMLSDLCQRGHERVFAPKNKGKGKQQN